MIGSLLLLVSYLFLIVFGLIGIDVINKKFVHKTIKKKKIIAMVLLFIACIFLVLSLYYILSFDKVFNGSVWFWTFAIFAFILLPISVALAVVAFLLYFKSISVKTAAVLIVSMLLFSFAASNFHDFLWCAHITNFYTQSKAG